MATDLSEKARRIFDGANSVELWEAIDKIIGGKRKKGKLAKAAHGALCILVLRLNDMEDRMEKAFEAIDNIVQQDALMADKTAMLNTILQSKEELAGLCEVFGRIAPKQS